MVSFGVLGAGLSVGHLGGELVYRHGAARAYLERAVAQPPAFSRYAPGAHVHDD